MQLPEFIKSNPSLMANHNFKTSISSVVSANDTSGSSEDDTEDVTDASLQPSMSIGVTDYEKGPTTEILSEKSTSDKEVSVLNDMQRMMIFKQWQKEEEEEKRKQKQLDEKKYFEEEVEPDDDFEI